MNYTNVTFRTENTVLQKLVDSAEQRCRQNIRMFAGYKVLIEGGGYHKVWLETQPMGGAMYASRNLEAALANQKIFMDHQREDGRLPGSIEYKDGVLIPQFDKFQGFCFPAPALDVWYLTGKDPAYLSQLFEVLERFDRYLWKVRDSDGDGCLETWCRYDTGEDDAVRYGDAPNAWDQEVPPDDSAVVPIASMDVMSYSYSAREVMAEIASIWGRDDLASELIKAAEQVKTKLRDYLWDEKAGTLFDRDKNHRSMPVMLHNPLRAMYWKSLSPADADRFVKEHLLNPEEFWTEMPLPSVAVNDPLFRNRPYNSWSGQSEALTYQRAVRALENYGYYCLIPRLGQKLFDAVGPEGRFVQQFDPFTMQPSGIDPDGKKQEGYGPAILSVLEYAGRMYGVHIVRDHLVWGTWGEENSTYLQEWNGQRFELELFKGRAALRIDGREIFTCPRDMRIETDLAGTILAENRLL